MAQTTTNLGLKKPDPDEFYDVADQNGNMDILDRVVGKNTTDLTALGKKVAQQKKDLEKEISDTLEEFKEEVGNITYDSSKEELTIPANFQTYDSSKEELIISII